MSDQPGEKPTVEIPKVPEWAVALTTSVKEGLTELRADVAEIKADVGLLGDSIRSLSERAARSENRLDEFEVWRARSSERARMEEAIRAKVDVDQAAQLAKVAEAAQSAIKAANAAQTSTLVAEIKSAVATPAGQKLTDAAVKLLLVLMSLATAYLMSKGHG